MKPLTVAFAGTLMNSSADLVTRVCQGDSDAFRLIFERYSRPVISFIYDMVNDRALAEELTQETFVRAFRSIHTMRAETKLSTWLFGIARNVARESLRARARANNHVDLADKSVMDLSDDKPVPVDGLLSKELNDADPPLVGRPRRRQATGVHAQGAAPVQLRRDRGDHGILAREVED